MLPHRSWKPAIAVLTSPQLHQCIIKFILLPDIRTPADHLWNMVLHELLRTITHHADNCAGEHLWQAAKGSVVHSVTCSAACPSCTCTTGVLTPTVLTVERKDSQEKAESSLRSRVCYQYQFFYFLFQHIFIRMSFLKYKRPRTGGLTWAIGLSREIYRISPGAEQSKATIQGRNVEPFFWFGRLKTCREHLNGVSKNDHKSCSRLVKCPN